MKRRSAICCLALRAALLDLALRALAPRWLFQPPLRAHAAPRRSMNRESGELVAACLLHRDAHAAAPPILFFLQSRNHTMRERLPLQEK